MNINVSENNPRVVEAMLRADFYLFIQEIFPLVSPNSPLMRNWHLEAMAYALARVLNGENPAADHHGTTKKPKINLRVGCIPSLCAGAPTATSVHLRKLCREPGPGPFKELSRRHAFAALPVLSENSIRPGLAC